MKKKTIAASILSIALCGSLATGATFALFTSEDSANIAINAGKVDVTATIDEASLDLYSPTSIAVDGTVKDATDAATDTNFANGGFAKIEENTLTLGNMTPGDKATFTIDIENNSNVAILYRTMIFAEGDLFDALTVTVDKVQIGTTNVSEWKALKANEVINDLSVEVELPVADNNNDYQEATAQISFVVSAIQGNAQVDTFVSTQEQLDEVLATAVAGDVISLGDGSFELGNGNAISTVEDITFVGIGNGTVIESTNGTKNCTIKNATVNDIYTLYDMTFENCAIDSTVTGVAKASRVSGSTTFTNCSFTADSGASFWADDVEDNATVSFTDCTFEGSVKCGAGANTTYSFTNCQFAKPTAWPRSSNVVIYAPTSFTNCSFDMTVGIRTAVGMTADQITLKETDTNIDLGAEEYVINNADGMFWFASQVNDNKNSFAGKTITLGADIDLENKPWTPVGQTGATQFLGTFDGQDHTISNLYIDSSAQTGGTYSSGLFGWIERHGNDAAYLMAVKNVKVDGATVKGNHNVAVIAGYLIGTIENCHVSNATVVCTHANNDACGDKAGIIAGNAAESTAVIKDCSATDCSVTAGRDAGQIVGSCIYGKVENCEATNVTVKNGGDCTGANIKEELIGRTN